MTMTTEDVRTALLEAFDVDARLPKVKGPARLKAQNIGGMVEDADELKASIAHAIAEATRGLTMADEETTNDNIAAVLRDKAPLPHGEHKWTGAAVARFLADAISIKVDPTTEEIAMMEERMAWLRLAKVEDSRVLVASLVAECAGRSQRAAARRLDMNLSTFQRAVDRALSTIVAGMNGRAPVLMAA